MSATDEPALPERGFEPIRVAEVVLAIYQWDGWRDSATTVGRRAEIIATVIGVTMAILAAIGGFIYLPGAVKLSAVVYSPLVGWGVRQWLFGWIADRRLRAVLDEVRSVVVPTLVAGAHDSQLRNLVINGGTTVIELSTIIRSERRESAVALIASEYDPSQYVTYAGDAGGG